MPTPKLSEIHALAAVSAMREHKGNAEAAAVALGLNVNTFKSRYRVGVQRTAQAGVEAPMVLKGTSTYFNRDGEATGQWVKTKVDDVRRQQALTAAIEAMAEGIPRSEPVEAPASTTASLCNLYSFFDYHCGMLAWNREGGDDWDLTIAEARLQSSFTAMVAQSPRAKKAIVVIGGDWVHFDGLLPVTPAHRNILDADGRFSNVVKVAIRCARFLCNLALEQHDEVELVVMEGNHDEAGSVWLRHMFSALFEDEPRLIVTDSELPFYVIQFGEVMLGFHHGHKVKNEQLPLLFAAQYPKLWGSTTRRAIHCGHRHHCDEKEYNGVTVVQHPTLAARDAYAARGGWIAERAVQAITYHEKYGQVGRVYICPDMLDA